MGENDGGDARTDRTRSEGRERTETRGWLARLRRPNRLVAVVLVVGVLFTTGGIAYSVSVGDGDQFTEFYLLAENDTGDLVAEDYPRTLSSDEPTPFYVGIDNHESRQTNYTVVASIQRVEVEDDGVRVVEEREVTRTSVVVSDGERRVQQLNVTAPMEGQDLRLVFRLYRDGAPDDPATADAYRELHLRVEAPADG